MVISIDIGAVSIKVIVVDKSGKVVERRSCLHHCRAEEETRRILASLLPAYGDEEGHILVTGAFGRPFAEAYGFPYVEEGKSLLYYLESLPEAVDFVMEMGGESARLTRLHPTFSGGKTAPAPAVLVLFWKIWPSSWPFPWPGLMTWRIGGGGCIRLLPAAEFTQRPMSRLF